MAALTFKHDFGIIYYNTKAFIVRKNFLALGSCDIDGCLGRGTVRLDTLGKQKSYLYFCDNHLLHCIKENRVYTLLSEKSSLIFNEQMK